MWRVRVKMLRGAPRNKADASLKLSLERLEHAQPAPTTPQDLQALLPVATVTPGQGALRDEGDFAADADRETPRAAPRGSLFTPSSKVFAPTRPVESAETLDKPAEHAAPLVPALLPTTSPDTAAPPQSSTIDPSASPPHLSVAPHLLREEKGQVAINRRKPGIPLLQVVGAVVTTALLAGLLTYSLTRRSPAPPALTPQWSELAENIANHRLATERAELERRRGLVAQDEERYLTGLEALVKSNEELAHEHERSLKRAGKLESSLEAFAERAAALSRGGPSPALRDSGSTLEGEARGYLLALAQMTEQLESEQNAARERALRLHDHLDHRPLRGRKVRVIHDPQRTEDAAQVVELLKSFELEAQLFAAEVSTPTLLKGRLFYSTDEEEAVALQIARLVEDFETVEPERMGVATPYMSLWIVGEPF